VADEYSERQARVFWAEWSKGGDLWKRVSVPATECPRISKEVLERERARAWREEWFRQEYMCEFLDSDDYVFSKELIEGAFSDDVKELLK